MQRVTEKTDFESDDFCEHLLALRANDSTSFSRLGKTTLAFLRKYEARKYSQQHSQPLGKTAQCETTHERRATHRIQRYLTATWEGNSGVHDATISDLSANGCFILTSGATKNNEYIKVSLLIPEKGWVNLCAVVTNYFEEIGFGVRFVQLTWEGAAQLPAQILTSLQAI